MMKRLICLVILTMGVTAGIQAAEYVLSVDGLACPFCAYGIEKRLRTLEGVETIQVDIEQGKVTVVTRDPIELTEDQLRDKVKEAGFTLRSFAPVQGNEDKP